VVLLRFIHFHSVFIPARSVAKRRACRANVTPHLICSMSECLHACAYTRSEFCRGRNGHMRATWRGRPTCPDSASFRAKSVLNELAGSVFPTRYVAFFSWSFPYGNLSCSWREEHEPICMYIRTLSCQAEPRRCETKLDRFPRPKAR
jgi:hypothetical protein